MMNSDLQKTKNWLAIMLLIIAAAVLGFFLYQGNQPKAVQSAIIVDNKPEVNENFSKALDVQALAFPQDHGPHLNYQTEWWYYTGNLQNEAGQRFGYQLTFFRRALQPMNETNERPSQWSTSQVYMAHFALTDVGDQRYYAYEKLSRGAAGLSGAQADPYRVWLQDWHVEKISQNQLGFETYQLSAAQGDISLELILEDLKGPILQGEQGFSRKGPENGQASYYYSLTRLKTSGKLNLGEQSYSVEGFSWMDHEYSTSVLSTDQVGWDWFSFQMEDNTELMLFQIRKKDGSIDPFSSGTWITADGSTQILSEEDFIIQVNKNWESPRTKAVYPAGWQIEIPKLQLQLTIEPLISDQELNLSYSYWEGAVKIIGTRAEKYIQGHGYVELTGYSQSMGGEF